MDDSTRQHELMIRPPEVAAPRPAIATLMIYDASDPRGARWLGVALTELLRRELGADGHFEMLPGVEVGRAQLAAGATLGQALTESELADLRERLRVDLVVSGSCRRMEEPRGTTLLLVARVQDARTGVVLAHGHVLGPDDALGAARFVAEALRKQLGLPSTAAIPASPPRARRRNARPRPRLLQATPARRSVLISS